MLIYFLNIPVCMIARKQQLMYFYKKYIYHLNNITSFVIFKFYTYYIAELKMKDSFKRLCKKQKKNCKIDSF